MLITTQDNFADREIVETLGLVRGNTIRARHVGRDIMASLRNLVGGEVGEYTKMIAEAKSKGADGIVCLRFTTSAIMQGAAELLAYGTAVKLKG